MRAPLGKRVLTPTSCCLLLLLLNQQAARGAFCSRPNRPQVVAFSTTTTSSSSSQEPKNSLSLFYPFRKSTNGSCFSCRPTCAALKAAPSSVPEGVLWTLRIGSAIVSYVGFLTYFDRPKGTLLVKLEEQVEIKQSSVPGAGLGLFAKTFLPKDTVLGTYPGVVVPLTQNLSKLRAHPACEKYVWRFSDNRYVIDPTNAQGILEDTSAGGNPSMPGSVALFATAIRPFFSVSTALCRINEPPKGMDVNVVTSENLHDRSVVFSLERDVLAGEEFFIDYGLLYDRSRYTAALTSSEEK